MVECMAESALIVRNAVLGSGLQLCSACCLFDLLPTRLYS